LFNQKNLQKYYKQGFKGIQIRKTFRIKGEEQLLEDEAEKVRLLEKLFWDVKIEEKKRMYYPSDQKILQESATLNFGLGESIRIDKTSTNDDKTSVFESQLHK
jgi:cobalamin biosynthesis Co2+ chelatase CbiK